MYNWRGLALLNSLFWNATARYSAIHASNVLASSYFYSHFYFYNSSLCSDVLRLGASAARPRGSRRADRTEREGRGEAGLLLGTRSCICVSCCDHDPGPRGEACSSGSHPTCGSCPPLTGSRCCDTSRVSEAHDFCPDSSGSGPSWWWSGRTRTRCAGSRWCWTSCLSSAWCSASGSSAPRRWSCSNSGCFSGCSAWSLTRA